MIGSLIIIIIEIIKINKLLYIIATCKIINIKNKYSTKIQVALELDLKFLY